MPVSMHQRLDDLVHIWEDRCLMLRLRAELHKAKGQTPDYPIEGPLKEWRSYRGLMRELAKQPFTEEEEEMFAAQEDIQELLEQDELAKFCLPLETIKAIGPYAPIPGEVAMWTGSSRRIYQLTEDMQDLLEATKLNGMTWGEAKLPFRSFIVRLPRPIVDAKGHAYDELLVGSMNAGFKQQGDGAFVKQAHEPFYIRLLHRVVDDAPYKLSEFERHAVDKAIRRRDVKTMARLLNEVRTVVGRNVSSRACIDRSCVADLDIGQSFHELMRQSYSFSCPCGGEHKEWDQAVHIAMAMCLYLLSLPAKARKRPDERQVGRSSLPPLAMGRDATVQTIAFPEHLPPELREALHDMRQGREVSAHFRTSHFRRAPGTANDPEAPKTVFVRWAFVSPRSTRNPTL